MLVSLTELRSNIYKYFEQIKTSGIPLHIKAKQGAFIVSFSKPIKRLDSLQTEGLDLFEGDPEDIVNIIWSNSSQEEKNLL
jgi:hypothetical protein